MLCWRCIRVEHCGEAGFWGGKTLQREDVILNSMFSNRCAISTATDPYIWQWTNSITYDPTALSLISVWKQWKQEHHNNNVRTQIIQDLSPSVCCPGGLFPKLIHIFLVIAYFIILSLHLHTHFSQRRIHPRMASPQGFFHLFSLIFLPLWGSVFGKAKPGLYTVGCKVL